MGYYNVIPSHWTAVNKNIYYFIVTKPISFVKMYGLMAMIRNNDNNNDNNGEHLYSAFQHIKALWHSLLTWKTKNHIHICFNLSFLGTMKTWTTTTLLGSIILHYTFSSLSLDWVCITTFIYQTNSWSAAWLRNSNVMLGWYQFIDLVWLTREK